MAENTTVGPAGANKSAMPVKPHETQSRKKSGSVAGNGTGSDASKGQAGKTGNPVNKGGM